MDDMKPTFEKTVDILVKAYLNDTLQHGWCSACAVGNLVADAIGTTPTLNCNRFANNEFASWNDVFMTGYKNKAIRDPSLYRGDSKRQIDATGYTWQELARIERAFETAPGKCDDYNDESWMFNGLMAVLDVLAEIHNIDLETKEQSKLLFVKP